VSASSLSLGCSRSRSQCEPFMGILLVFATASALTNSGARDPQTLPSSIRIW